MTTLNQEFKKCCVTNTSKILYDKNDIYRIKNFFVDPIKAKEFLTSLPWWDCDELDKNLKPGMEIVLPIWANDFFCKKIFEVNNISVINKDPAIINMHYYGMTRKHNSLKSSNGIFDFPHQDFIYRKENDIKCFVLLVNLNQYEINTNFWKFKNKCLMESNDYNRFCEDYQKKLKSNDLNCELKMPKELKICHQAKFMFNEAIIYNASLLHNANILKFYTRNNPRITLRYMFFVKKFNILKYNYI